MDTGQLHRVYGRPVPEGWVVDHLCGNRGCIEPTHLEAVTRGDNVRRGNRGVTHQLVLESFCLIRG